LIWVILGTAVVVTGVVLIGLAIDKRVPLLPRAEPPPAPVLPPPRTALGPGEAAATAVRVPTTWRTRIAAGRCTCGKPLAVESDEPIVFAGRRMVVVRLVCAACGHARSVYLEPSGAPPEPAPT
jgi:hypothetical protein